MTKWGAGRFLVGCASAVAMCWAAPALAGEEILYQSAPEWIVPVDLATAKDNARTSLVVLDQQVRLEGGLQWQYSDTAIRIATPQELNQAGTVSAAWLPDKGDLIVHEVSILRGSEVIDVLGQGAKLSTLRREQGLERRMLDGILTATMAVPGLQVGDILRLRVSVTAQDQALGDEVQSLSVLYREPDVRPGSGRVIASWKQGEPIRFQAGPNVQLPPVQERDGYEWLELSLPLAKAEEMPEDAPARFHRPSLLQVGSFDNWAEVAAVMAPLYSVEGAIAPGSELAARVEAIKQAHTTPLSQAIAALKLVQDEISYLANGMDGGNYIPQSVQDTWSLRYGDCKAKTVLLLALLAELGIDAEPVLVSSQIGDSIPQLLPMPGVFDHVLVRAKIGGHDYWLDGTSAGANEKIAGNVPPFHHGLPVRASGSELEPIVQVLPRVPELSTTFEYDMRAGFDLPALVTIHNTYVGPAAAVIDAGWVNMTDEMRAEAFSDVPNLIGIAGLVYAPGSDGSEATISILGISAPLARYEDGQPIIGLPVASNEFTFNPDRARRAWRDVPVAVSAPVASELRFEVLLPENGRGVVMSGPASLEQSAALRSFRRDARLAGARLEISELITAHQGEITASDLSSARAEAAVFARNKLEVRGPHDGTRRWRFAGNADRTALEALENEFGQMIELSRGSAQSYTKRADFRLATYDFAGALEDLTTAIEQDQSAYLLARRADVFLDLRDPQSALSDLEEAHALDPGPYRAIDLAGAMAMLGDIAGARALLEDQHGADDDAQRALVVALAEVDAAGGDVAGGLGRLDELLSRKPDDAELLNAKCWHMGVWQVQLTDAAQVCTRAVERAGNSSAVLDSRALAYLRAGRLDEALADADAALAIAPEQTPTTLLRGLILRAKGDAAGELNIRQAIARNPSLAEDYRRYGFDL